MKSKFFYFLIIIFILLTGSFSANAQIKKACIGKWSFDAPSAPDGYTYGLIEISKDSVKTSFTTSNFKFPSIWVKAKNDSVTYKAIIDGTDVIFSLKIENETSIKGNAVWYEGETLMILKKNEK